MNDQLNNSAFKPMATRKSEQPMKPVNTLGEKNPAISLMATLFGASVNAVQRATRGNKNA